MAQPDLAYSLVKNHSKKLRRLFEILLRLRSQEEIDPNDTRAFQLLLISNIKQVEYAKDRVDAKITALRNELRVAKEAESDLAKITVLGRKLVRLRSSRLNYELLARAYRSLGDSLALLFIPFHDFKAFMTRGAPGRITRKLGTRAELKYLHKQDAFGGYMIFHGATNALTYGDLSFFKERGYPPVIIESKGKTSIKDLRVEKQKKAADHILGYMRDDEVSNFLGTGNGAIRVEPSIKVEDHRKALNKALKESRDSKLHKWMEFEPGFRIGIIRVEDSSPIDDVMNAIVHGCNPPVLVQDFSMTLWEENDFIPMQDYLDSPDDFQDIVSGKIRVLITLSESRIVELFAQSGIKLERDQSGTAAFVGLPLNGQYFRNGASHFYIVGKGIVRMAAQLDNLDQSVRNQVHAVTTTPLSEEFVRKQLEGKTE